ncbi:hypothetical protein RTBOTA2_004070 [Rhodotorula toruloides]|nr:hypothetical protein RTBOTA2_004070 [Rhodotorula toruloides]
MLDRADPSMAEGRLPTTRQGPRDRAGVCDKQEDSVQHSKGDGERARGERDGTARRDGAELGSSAEKL